MVGLPARGKSYLARKLAYYLNWLQIPTKIFNLGDYRRRKLGVSTPAGFFHRDNKEAMKLREEFARDSLRDLFLYCEGDGQVGILDGANSTEARRKMIEAECAEHGVEVFWVESLCTNVNVRFQQLKVTLS